MNKKLLAMASLVGAVFVSATAQADVIAGWDFSQFASPGALGGGSNPLPANYASQDPNGAGSESASYGSLAWTGTFLPTAGSGRNRIPFNEGPINSNIADEFEVGEVALGAESILKAEGQTNASRLAMVATSSSTLTFTVTPPSSGLGNFRVSFGAKIRGGGGPNGGPLSCDPIGGPNTCASTVTVEHAPDCSSYTSYPSVNLSLDDERYSVDLGTATDTDAFCVRLGLTPSSGEPVIDNVTIVPEPGLAFQLVAGLAGLGWLARRHRSRSA